MKKLNLALLTFPLLLHISCKSYSTDTILGKWEINLEETRKAIEKITGEKFDWKIIQQEYYFLEDRLITKTKGNKPTKDLYILKKAGTDKIRILFTNKKKNPEIVTLKVIDQNHMILHVEGAPPTYLVRKIDIKEKKP